MSGYRRRRQIDPKTAAGIEFGFHTTAPAHALNGLGQDSEANTSAGILFGVAGTLEEAEYLFARHMVHANAIVFDPQADVGPARRWRGRDDRVASHVCRGGSRAGSLGGNGFRAD